MADILYLGDTAIDQQASYLAGILSHFGVSFDYVPSDQSCADALTNDYKTVIISDYPSANFTSDSMDLLIEKVSSGCGLLMLGGWESYVGLGGGYNKTKLAEVLPVEMASSDDRVNYSGPCLVIKNAQHQITNNLPFETNAPCIGGFNKFKAKSDSQLILSSQQYKASINNGTAIFTPAEINPLLVLGKYKNANVATFASDVAPHWVGPLVDWGNQRLIAQAPNAEQIEVGNHYAQLFMNIVKYVLKIS